MRWTELHETLTQLALAIQPPDGSRLSVDHAELDVPLEATVFTRGDTLVFLGRVPHSRWQAGVLPVTHRSRLVLERYEPERES